MNPAQLKKYHVNRRKWEAARAARGFPHGDAALAQLKLRKLGRVCSSKAFTQDDFDDMLAAFAAVDDPANLDTQLDIAEQGERRKLRVRARIEVLSQHLQLNQGGEAAYVAAIARKTFDQGDVTKLTFEQLAVLEGQVLRRLRQLHDAERVAAIQTDAAEHGSRVSGLPLPVVVSDGAF